MDFLQKLILWMEVGGGGRWVRRGVVVLGVLLLAVTYNWLGYRNMATAEAMDMAQVGRNLAEGKGYTTAFIRPLSIYLLREKKAPSEGAARTQVRDPELLAHPHPDLANPPLYPLVLAGLMYIIPFEYNIPEKPVPFFNTDGHFSRYQPDFLIGVFNQALFFSAVFLMFLLAQRLFGPGVGWLTAAVMIGTDLFWQFSVSGLSTNLLLLIFIGVIWCLVLLDEEAQEPCHGLLWPYLMAAAAGLLVAAGALTRYSFGWMIIPVVAFLVLSPSPRRFVLGGLTSAVFLCAFAPWIVRNIAASGLPFGVATFSVLEATGPFPEYQLARSFAPDFSGFSLTHLLWGKLVVNGRLLVTAELPQMAGNWISAFFLVGLFIDFRSPTVRRLRLFSLASLALLAVAQALGKSQASIDVPVVNGENLLVLLVPLVVLFGVNLFMVVFEQIEWPVREMRLVALVFIVVILSLPMVLRFIPPRTNPVVFPPYNPPAIQLCGKWLEPGKLTPEGWTTGELSMSDMPWAMAWYGQRQSVWSTLKVTAPLNEDATETFFAVHDYFKSVTLVLLSHITVEQSIFREDPWNNFILVSSANKQVPTWFPLRSSPPGWAPHYVVLTDSVARMQKSR